jgi:hypothetical protein
VSESNHQKSSLRLAVPQDGETYRHKRRGSTYTVLGRAILQTSAPIGDDQELVVYRGKDGELWARSVAEFCDGRFERLPGAPEK